MVGWRTGSAAISAPPPPSSVISSVPPSSTQLFQEHFKARGPVNRAPSPPPSPPSSRRPGNYSPPMPPRLRGVFLDGPVFANKYQKSTKSPPISNGTPLMVLNGDDAPKSKKRRAPPPPEPPIDYNDGPPPAPVPPPILVSSGGSTAGSVRSLKKVSINDQPEIIKSADEKAFDEFKDELSNAAEERGKKGHVEPPIRPPKSPVEASLNDALKSDIIKAAEERQKKPWVEPVVRSNTLVYEKVKTPSSTVQMREKQAYPALPDELQQELKKVWGERFDRRKSGSLRMKSNKSKVLYTALPATMIGKAVKKDQTKDWVPEQDLVDDVLDGPITVQEHTSRNSKDMPTFFPVFMDPTKYDLDSLRRGPSSKISNSSQSSVQGGKKGRRFKNSFKKAWGSLRNSLGRKNKLKDILDDPQWEIYHAENYDPAPKGPINIHHIEKRPAYAYNAQKAQLMLIPDFDRVLITSDGRHIREDTLTKVAKNVSESSPVPPPDVPGKPEEALTDLDKERQEQMRTEMQFQIVRRQVSDGPDEVFHSNGPVRTSSMRDENYSSLDRLIARRDRDVRSNPIYDSDDEDYVDGSSSENSRTETKKHNKLEDSGYMSNGTPPMHYTMPPVIPLAPQVAMYPGMPVAPGMVPYMVPANWAVPQPVSLASSMNSGFVPQAPASEISMGSKGTTINIQYDQSTALKPEPVIPPPVANTSPQPFYRPVKFTPMSRQNSQEPRPVSPPPPPAPASIVTSPPEPEPEITTMTSSITTETIVTSPPEPKKYSRPISPIPKTFTPAPFTPSSPADPGRPPSFSYTSGVEISSTKPSEVKKAQVVPDKEMPDFYRNDFYRKILTGPVGFKPVNFNPDTAKSKYLFDEVDEETGLRKMGGVKKLPTPQKEKTPHDKFKDELSESAEKRSKKGHVEPPARPSQSDPDAAEDNKEEEEDPEEKNEDPESDALAALDGSTNVPDQNNNPPPAEEPKPASAS